MKGTVKWYNRIKGYGFINPEGEASKDVFVHYSSIQVEKKKDRVLEEGGAVEFELREGDRGEFASNVRKV